MNVFTSSMVRGINDRLVKEGFLRWPDEKTAEEVCLQLSDMLQGPEMLPDSGLSKESALSIGQHLKAASDALVAEGKVPEAQAKAYGEKVAAVPDIQARALEVAFENMKIAEALIMQGGEHSNTPQAAASDEQVARLDEKNRPQGTYVVGVGHTEMPDGGEVGKQIPHPKAPATSPPINNSLTVHKAASARELLAKIVAKAPTNPGGKLAALSALLSGEQRSTPENLGAAKRGFVELRKLAAREEYLENAKVANLDQLSPDQIMELAQAIQSHGDADPGNDVDLASLPPEILHALMDIGQPSHDEAAAAGGGMPGGGMPGGGEGSPFAAKGASALDKLKAAAAGSLTGVGQNTPESAAKTEQLAALDEKNRPAGKYKVETGHTAMRNVGHVGAAQTPENAPSATAHPENTATREQAKAAELTAEERDWVSQVEKMAELYADKLPAQMPATEKIAQLKKLVGMPPSDRPGYLKTLSQ
jgi:hypothetical protein